MSKNLFFLFILISIPIFITTSLSQTSVPSGEVYGTWDYAGSPYQVQGDITIPNDSTLIIKQGVIVEFEGYYALNVQGRLLAIGNEVNNIIFTVNDTTGFYKSDTTLGGWNGIHFIDTPLDNDTSKIIFCTIQYGKAVSTSPPNKSGGAIFISNFNKLLISNCLISNNSAGGSDSPSGGGLCLQSADIILVNNEISYNHAWDGGGIQIWESDPVFINNKIVFNTADEGGGGIWIGGMSNSEFDGDDISNNTAGGNGGGIICWQTTNTTLNAVTFNNNIANWGGGIGVIECKLEIDSCTFINNGSFEMGGGLGSNSSTVNINNTNFENDSAGNSGGGIFTWQSDLEIDNSEFNNNKAKYSGGGVCTDSTIIYITNSGFVENTATDNGGAIFLNLSTAILNNSSFEQNSAVWGGGILSGYGKLDINNSSFSENSSEHGGAINFGFGNAEFYNLSFIKNTGIWGGGISVANCDLYIDGCLFSQNTATGEAGAIEYLADTTIYDRRYNFKLRETDFMENSATTSSGAVRIEQTKGDSSMVDLVLDSCQFTENHSYAHGSLRIAGYIENFIVSNCLFNGNTAERNTGGPGFAANSKGEVYNCVFNSNYYSFTDSTKSAHGVSLQTEAEVDFINCTIVDTSSATGYALAARRGAKANLINCVLWGCGDRPIILTTVADLGCKVNVNYCDIENGTDSLKVSDSMSVINWGDGNIAEDPLFVDMKNADLHLLDSSPCIGAGIDSKEINGTWFYCPTTDIEGNPRPYPPGSIPDMGAYENELSIPVPVELISFTASVSKGKVLLKWVTSTEKNNLGFEIERKINDKNKNGNWVFIGFTEGYGTTTKTKKYFYNDDLSNISSNSIFYRLKQIDYDGTIHYSSEVSIDNHLPLDFALYQNYPNPFNPTTTIKYDIPKQSFITLKVYDVLGMEVATLVNEFKKPGSYEITFNTEGLSSGIYFYSLKADNFQKTKKMVLMK